MSSDENDVTMLMKWILSHQFMAHPASVKMHETKNHCYITVHLGKYMYLVYTFNDSDLESSFLYNIHSSSVIDLFI